ncbi:hypothetical protein [Aquirufa salirivi]|uniref:Uncharacterized protein n=1 Tax=Aquirufa salirivi TaxID=3104729 RepID=A0ABW8RTA6_9BACT
MPNLLTRLRVAIDQIEIKYLEEQVIKRPNSEEIKNKLKEVRNNFEDFAKYAGLIY